MEIPGKVVIITGAGSGIGRAMALAFGREAAQVICCGRRIAPLEETAGRIREQGGVARAFSVDVVQVDQVEAVVASVVKEFGRVDVLINNAASFSALGAVWEVDLARWWDDIEINLKGPVHFCRAVLPSMIAQEEGVIVNITAQAGTAAKPGCSGYACSKAALIHLTNTLASELAMKQLPIWVFGLDPGFNRTEMTQGLGQMAEVDFWLPGLITRVEMATGTEPEGVAKTAIELVRSGDRALSGRTMSVSMPIESLKEQAREIEDKDLLTLRFRHLT